MELRDWLSLVNLALFPILVYLRRIDGAIAKWEAWRDTHSDHVHGEIDRRLERLEK